MNLTHIKKIKSVKITLLQNIIDFKSLGCIDCTFLRSKFVLEHPKLYIVKSEDNHKICTYVFVPLFKGMHGLALSDRFEFLK